jgi:protein SHQ1
VDEINELVLWEGPFAKLSKSGSVIEFTEEENLAMIRLPRKECRCTNHSIAAWFRALVFVDLASPEQTRTLYLTLISILFSYAYDCRTTLHEPTSESAWTICSLTPCFSALDTSPSASLALALTSSFRRALSFPLHRNWLLCERCQYDVSDVLKSGRRGVTRALLEVKGILDKHEVYYVYAKIWVDDFIVWTQSLAK